MTNLEPLCHALAMRMYKAIIQAMDPNDPIKFDSTEWPDYAVDAMCDTARKFLKSRVRVLKKER